MRSRGPPGGGFEYLQAGGDLYFHRVPQAGTMLHTHDFAEVLLVTGGGLEHRVNGERQHLETGSICFLRPDDLHGFAPDAKAEPCEIVMLDFGLDVFLSLSVYLENDAFLQQLTAPVLPPRFRLDPASCGALYSQLLKLNNAATPPALRKAELKVLLGELFTRFFLDPANVLSEAQVPCWLAQLCVAMGRPEELPRGRRAPAASRRAFFRPLVQVLPETSRQDPHRLRQRAPHQPRRETPCGQPGRHPRDRRLSELPEPQSLLQPLPAPVRREPRCLPQAPRRRKTALTARI